MLQSFEIGKDGTIYKNWFVAQEAIFKYKCTACRAVDCTLWAQ